MLAFCALAAAITGGTLVPLDRAASALATQYRTPLLTSFFSTVTLLGDAQVLAPVLILALVVGMTRPALRRPCFWLVLLACSTGLFNVVLKTLFARSRPDELLANPLLHQTSYSFPSGHAMVAICLLGFLCHMALTSGRRSRALGWTLGVLVVAVGYSRVYLGVHYPVDVLAGYLAGTPLLTLGILTYRLQPKSLSSSPPG